MEGLPQAGGWTGGGEQVATVGAALAVPAGTGLLIPAAVRFSSEAS